MKDIIKTLGFLGALAFGGCASTIESTSEPASINLRRSSKYQETMDVMGLKRIEQVSNLGNGYFTSKSEEMELDYLSRIYSGDSEITVWDSGYSIKTSKDDPRDPETFKKICERADTSEDNIITTKERKDLTGRIIDEYRK